MAETTAMELKAPFVPFADINVIILLAKIEYTTYIHVIVQIQKYTWKSWRGSSFV